MKSFQNHTDGTSFHVLDGDDTLTDAIGSPGDQAVIITASGVTFYPAKGVRVPGKGFGVWGAGVAAGADFVTERAAAVTLTNKRITKRVLATAGPGGTPTINTDSYDVVNLTALAANITSMTTNLTGTPVAGDSLRIAFTDNGTARTITWGASFESSTYASLPGTTVISTRMDVAFVWNTATSKWRCVGVA